MEKFDPYTEEVPKDWEYVRDRGLVDCDLYRAGARVRFIPRSEPEDHARGVRDIILDQSKASRLRCALDFHGAECDWYALSLLTWRFDPGRKHCLLAADRLRRKWRARWGEPLCGWVMEMQERGVPHFHLLHSTDSNFGVACRASGNERVTRENGTEADVVRGGPDYWLRDAWLSCIGASDAKSRWFCSRGMIELARSPDAAGRYFAKEIGKRQQKVLPPGYEDGLGRWWWLNPRFKPRVRHQAILDLEMWPWDQPLARVWSHDDLMPAMRSIVARTDLDADSTAPQPATQPYSWSTVPRKPRQRPPLPPLVQGALL